MTNTEQLRAHAANVWAIRARFDAVKAASAHIARDDAAYGTLCGWIAGVLGARHTRQDELIAYLEENLALAVQQLMVAAQEYDVAQFRASRSGGAGSAPAE